LELLCRQAGDVAVGPQTFVPYCKADAYRGLARCERCGEEIEM
jgi:hypothetical protein